MFAGQGAQKKGMGFDLYQADNESKELFDKFPEIRDLCFTDETGALNETKNAQPSILLESYIVANYLKNKGITPEYACGLSLGEYSALLFGQSFSLEDGIAITKARGEIMQNALPLGTTSMAAIIGTDVELIKSTISTVNGVCEIANYNSPAQIVITGENAAIDEAMEKLKAAGAKRCIKLNVSGAFHSSLLNGASIELNKVLNSFNVKKPNIKLVYNTYGTESDENVIDILTKQIKSSVMFIQSVEYMIQNGVDTFIEIGPGSALSGFVKKINSDVKVYSTDTLSDINKVLEELL